MSDLQLCIGVVEYVSFPCWRKNEIVTKRPPKGPRLMIFGAIRIISYAESDGNGPAAQNLAESTENGQKRNLIFQLIQAVEKELPALYT